MGHHPTGARVLLLAATCSTTFWLLACTSDRALAREPAPFGPPNPLEQTEPDPLLPDRPDDRPLTDAERDSLGRSADELAAAARGEYAAGNVDAAFETWYRSLRLRRVLGPAIEIPALGEVGEAAWTANVRKFDIQVIGDRLIAISSELPPADRALRLALAEAFAQLRLSDRAAVLYEELLPGTPAGDREAVLASIARLRQARFDYLAAAAAYEELLALASEGDDRLAEIRYLQELDRLYALAERPEDGARARERLLAQYADLSATDPTAAPKIPALLVGIGRNYAALERADIASSAYQDAYERARDLKQYAVASEALTALGELYEDSGQPAEAARAYTELVRVQQQSLDRYGLVGTYERLGELHLAQDDPARALDAFERALELAESIGYEPERFVARIEGIRSRLP